MSESKSLTKIEPIASDMLSRLVLDGNLSGLNPAQKVEYYIGFCRRVGLDPATKPFDILKLNGKEVLYATRACAQQLSALHKVSHTVVDRRELDGCFMVTARAFTADGRQTESIGAVPVAGIKGEARCNALMKAETKAKRRATLDLLGLGITDESEVESIQGAKRANFDPINTPVAALTPEPQAVKTPPSGQGLAGKGLPERIAGLRLALADKYEWAVGYLRCWTAEGSDANATLMPHEGLEDLPETAVNYLALHWKDFMGRLDEYIKENSNVRPEPPAKDEDQIPGAEAKEPTGPAFPQSCESIKGTIALVSYKSGTSKKGSWLLCGVEIGQIWYNSFSKSIADFVKPLKGEVVELFYVVEEKGNRIVAITHDGKTVQSS